MSIPDANCDRMSGVNVTGPVRLSWRTIGLLLLLALSPLALAQTDYFVATNGHDANDGLTSTSAWRRVSHAVSMVASGSVIHITPGEYVESPLLITEPITLQGSNLYHAAQPPLARHETRSRIRIRQGSDYTGSAFVDARIPGVTVHSLTIDGDAGTNGTPDIKFGVNTSNRPITIAYCSIINIQGFGISCYGTDPPPDTNDTDAVRSYIGYNYISNITHTTPASATGIYLGLAQATCEHNEITDITGINANAAIYAFRCKYVPGTNWVSINNNYIDNCVQAIWANRTSGEGEAFVIRDNTVTNGIIGIRVTRAYGPGLISGNDIHVSGISPSGATPARGIWLQSDDSPWTPPKETDHQVIGNLVKGQSTTADGTTGIYLEYGSPITVENNGLRATLLSNTVMQFDTGVYIEDGTLDVGISNSPQLRVVAHYNDIIDSFSWGMVATNVTEPVNATSNWWGRYTSPTSPPSLITGDVDVSGYLPGGYNIDTDGDGTNDATDIDDDGDRLLDTNELAIGTSPINADTDGDTYNDYNEVLAGTQPTNRTSVFTIVTNSWTPANGTVLIWSSVTGRTYRVYSRTNMIQGTWTYLTNFAGTPPTNSYLDPGALPNPYLFYRVTATN